MRLAVRMLAVILISLAVLLGTVALFAFFVDDGALAAVSLVALVALAGGALVLLRDRQATQDLASVAARLRAVLEASRDGILVFDSAGRLEAWNERGLQLLNLPAELARRGTPLARFATLDRKRGGPPLFEPPPASDADTGRMLSLRPGGRELVCRRARLPQGGFLIASMEVAGGVRSEAIAPTAQPMEPVEPLPGGVAHDFNNVLQIIKASLDLLVRDVADNPRAMRRLRDARTSAEHGAALVRAHLPRAQPVADHCDLAVVAPAGGGTETVLVVEDDAAVRRATAEMLGDLGYRVVEAADGRTLRSSSPLATARMPSTTMASSMKTPPCSASPTARTNWRGRSARRSPAGRCRGRRRGGRCGCSSSRTTGFCASLPSTC